MRLMRTHAHVSREPATTRWVRAAGADIARFGAARPLGCRHSACFRSRLLNLDEMPVKDPHCLSEVPAVDQQADAKRGSVQRADPNARVREQPE
jgi:hypothetical protein